MATKIGRNDPCWCGCGKKYKTCHASFDDRLAKLKREGHIVPTRNLIKTPEQIAGIKESAKINVAVLDYIAENIHEGMSTAEIDKMVYEKTTEMGGILWIMKDIHTAYVPQLMNRFVMVFHLKM